MSEQTTRAGIPLDTLPEQPTVRQAANALIESIGRNFEVCDCEYCDRIRALRDALANDYDERAIIRRAADYIEFDRAMRDAWATRMDDPDQFAQLSARAQMARVCIGDEAVAMLRRMGGEA